MAAIVGSRILFIILEWRHYLAHPMDVLKVWEGGLVFLGGLLGCILTAYFYLKKHRLSFWQVSDVFMPGVALGHAFGRVGCFLAGCCYGKACDALAWYGLVFPDKPGTLAPGGVALYPTQLMEAGTEFLTFLFLAWKSSKKAFDGQIFLLYLILYSIFRILIELLRGDVTRGFVIPHWISTSQLIGILLIVFAVIMLVYRKRRSP